MLGCITPPKNMALKNRKASYYHSLEPMQAQEKNLTKVSIKKQSTQIRITHEEPHPRKYIYTKKYTQTNIN
jgi:hypothetical protein